MSWISTSTSPDVNRPPGLAGERYSQVGFRILCVLKGAPHFNCQGIVSIPLRIQKVTNPPGVFSSDPHRYLRPSEVAVGHPDRRYGVPRSRWPTPCEGVALSCCEISRSLRR